MAYVRKYVKEEPKEKKNKAVNDLKNCIKQLDKIFGDVMDIETEELNIPIEKLVSKRNELVSYSIFCSMIDLKNAVVELAGDE